MKNFITDLLVRAEKALATNSLTDSEECYRIITDAIGEKKYDPSEARNARGEWTRAGGIGTGYAWDSESESWLDHKGKPMPKKLQKLADELKLSKNLVGVKFNPDPNGYTAAIGHVLNGRTGIITVDPKYFIRKGDRAASYKAKFDELKKFNSVREKLHTQSYKDGADGIVAARVTFLMSRTGMRVGSEVGSGKTVDKKTGKTILTYGASQLEARHVKVRGDTVYFDFMGKGAHRWNKAYKDAKLATIINQALTNPDGTNKKSGDKLFTKKSKKVDNSKHVTADTISTYMKENGGKHAKDVAHPHVYRYWWATNKALEVITRHPRPLTANGAASIKRQACEAAADFLNDKPETVYQTYINPLVWMDWGDDVRPTAPILHDGKGAKPDVETLTVTRAQNLMSDLFESVVFPDFSEDEEDKSSFLELFPDPDEEGYVSDREGEYAELTKGEKAYDPNEARSDNGRWASQNQTTYLSEEDMDGLIKKVNDIHKESRKLDKPLYGAPFLVIVDDEKHEFKTTTSLRKFLSACIFPPGFRTFRNANGAVCVNLDEVDGSKKYNPEEDRDVRGRWTAAGSKLPKKLYDKIKRRKNGEGGEVKLSSSEIKKVLRDGIYGFLSAGRNPNDQKDGKLSDKEVSDRYDKLKSDLVSGGYMFTKTKGHYNGEEDSFLIMAHEADRKDMLSLGKKYNQDSVIYAEGEEHEMLFTTGPNEGKKYDGEGIEDGKQFEDFYSEIDTTDEAAYLFSLVFNFDKLNEKKYNPNQARDDRGRWGVGAGERDKPKPNTGEKQSVARDRLMAFVGHWKGAPANPNEKETHLQYKNEAGGYTAERQELHRLIEDYFLSAATPVSNPVAHVMGGGPASGKSVLYHSASVGVPSNHVLINADDIKSFIPEYTAREGVANDPESAAKVHEESAELADSIRKKATTQSKHIVLDATGNTSFDHISAKVSAFRDAKMPVHAHYATCPTEVALERNVNRFKATGRMVPPSYVSTVHSNVSSILPVAIASNLFNTVTLHDTHNDTGEAQLVLKAKGRDATIVNEDLWRKFLAKSQGKKSVSMSSADMQKRIVDITLGKGGNTPLCLSDEIDIIVSQGGVVEIPSDWA